MAFPLLDLPFELQARVVLYIKVLNQADLAAFCRTSHWAHRELNHSLYESPSIASIHSLVAFERTIFDEDSSLTSASWVKEITFRLGELGQGWVSFNAPFAPYDTKLDRFISLRSINFIKPSASTRHDWDSFNSGRSTRNEPEQNLMKELLGQVTYRGLGRMSKSGGRTSVFPISQLTLDFGGGVELWRLDIPRDFMFHPFLTHLTLINVDTSDAGYMARIGHPSTSLTSLTLINSEIEVGFLDNVLENIKSLKKFAACFTNNIWGPLHANGEQHSGRWIDVLFTLRRHASSFEYIEFTEGGAHTTIAELELPLDFTESTKLRRLVLETSIECTPPEQLVLEVLEDTDPFDERSRFHGKYPFYSSYRVFK